MKDLYVDSSVVLRAALGHSPATLGWFNAEAVAGRAFVASRLGLLEVERVAHNAGRAPDVAGFTSRFAYVALDDALVDEARAIASPLKAADALHLATALRLGTDEVRVVTHDAQMARAAEALDFDVIDPVTDDPGRAPVA